MELKPLRENSTVTDGTVPEKRQEGKVVMEMTTTQCVCLNRRRKDNDKHHKCHVSFQSLGTLVIGVGQALKVFSSFTDSSMVEETHQMHDRVPKEGSIA